MRSASAMLFYVPLLLLLLHACPFLGFGDYDKSLGIGDIDQLYSPEGRKKHINLTN